MDEDDGGGGCVDVFGGGCVGLRRMFWCWMGRDSGFIYVVRYYIMYKVEWGKGDIMILFKISYRIDQPEIGLHSPG